MGSGSSFENIQGILAVFAQETNWPNPANIFIIPDETGFSLIDVGCGAVSSIDRLMRALSYWGLKIEQLHTVVLSHAHPDHVGAMWWILEQVRPKVFIHHQDVAPALDPIKLGETFDIPLAKHCWAAYENSNGFKNFDLLRFFEDSGCPMSAAERIEELHEGETLRLDGFTFEVFHTPGHSPGHISLFEKNRHILLSGDLVGRAPAWYTPTSGGVIGYLKSLQKMEDLNAMVLLPAHGRIIENPAQAIQKMRTQLRQRESILKKAIHEGGKLFMELNQILFASTHFHFFPGCGIIESHLIKLEKEGVIKREGQHIVPNGNSK